MEQEHGGRRKYQINLEWNIYEENMTKENVCDDEVQTFDPRPRPTKFSLFQTPSPFCQQLSVLQACSQDFTLGRSKPANRACGTQCHVSVVGCRSLALQKISEVLQLNIGGGGQRYFRLF